MLEELLSPALNARRELLSELDPRGEHHAALRLFNGFFEGLPELAVDLYGRTLVIFDYAQYAQEGLNMAQSAAAFYRSALPWLACVLHKTRRLAKGVQQLSGAAPDQQVSEYGVRYAIDLTLHQDNTLYLDTRLLRRWVIEHLSGKSVLNTFAYTGSLGAAARSAGARRVLQSDLDRSFLAIAKQTFELNVWPVNQADFIASDFFSLVARLKAQQTLFDCIILDPPFFSTTTKGRVDINQSYASLANKVRPLVAHDGWLVAVNNAIYVSGQAYLAQLNELCASGYLSIEELILVPPDFTGLSTTPPTSLPADPSPFNHSTKIAVLRVRRKDGRGAI